MILVGSPVFLGVVRPISSASRQMSLLIQAGRCLAATTSIFPQGMCFGKVEDL